MQDKLLHVISSRIVLRLTVSNKRGSFHHSDNWSGLHIPSAVCPHGTEKMGLETHPTGALMLIRAYTAFQIPMITACVV